jgi:hypothetical protein
MIRKIIFVLIIFLSFNKVLISANQKYISFSLSGISLFEFTNNNNAESDDFISRYEKIAYMDKVFLGLGIPSIVACVIGLGFIFACGFHWFFEIFIIGISLIALHLPFAFACFSLFGYYSYYLRINTKINKIYENDNNAMMSDNKYECITINLFSIGIN